MLNFLNKCKDKYKKYAMTLAEVLMVFAIIGVVASMTIYTAKPFDKNMKYAYAKAYDTLNVAIYNSRTNLPKYLMPDENGNSNPLMYKEDKTWPKQTETFCKMLLEYINFKAEDVKGPNGPNVGGSIPIDQADNNFSVANCSAAPINVTQSKEKLNNDLRRFPPHFVASNGMKFWMAGINKMGDMGGRTLTVTGSNGSKFYLRYYLVLVDLNGDLRPNSVEITDKKVGDIVAFMVTDANEVIPVGRPEVDRRYLSARVVYNVNIDQTAEASTSSSMTYYEAKRMAWAAEANNPGLYVVSNNPMSVNVYEFGNGLKNAPAFKQDYTQPPYNEINNRVTYDKDWCYKRKSPLVNPEEPDAVENKELNPTACYVKITDYF